MTKRPTRRITNKQKITQNKSHQGYQYENTSDQKRRVTYLTMIKVIAAEVESIIIKVEVFKSN